MTNDKSQMTNKMDSLSEKGQGASRIPRDLCPGSAGFCASSDCIDNPIGLEAVLKRWEIDFRAIGFD
jgi:hypothetical protein